MEAEEILAWEKLNQTGDLLGLPGEWVICPHCGAQMWRFPPHTFDPCPLVMQMAEAAGLKVDAERATAIRAGIQLETMTKLVNKLTEQEDDA